MTVTYSDDIATAKFSTIFNIIFRRWRGSVFKLLWKSLLIYFLFFYMIHIANIWLTRDNFSFLADMINYSKKYDEITSMSFVLGFFVSQIMTRWWDQYLMIPRPNRIAVYVSCSVQGDDEVGRMIRRTIMRYVCLTQTLLFRKLSEHVRRRFPMMTDLVTAGLLTNCELKIIEDMEEKFPGFTKNWMPIVWAASIVSRARAEGRIKDDFSAIKIIEALNLFRSKSNILIHYHTINIPLVYTQVVCIAVYFHFLVKLFSDQQSSSQANEIQFFVFPVILMFQFIVYMGWLKVAETMINPFGNDDDDFELNDIIDFSLQTGYFIVDDMHDEHPDLLKDQYWNAIPKNLPGRTKDSSRRQSRLSTDIFNLIQIDSKYVMKRPSSSADTFSDYKT